MNEWDLDNVVVCGTSDGVVKIYSCVMVENDGSVEAPHIEPQVLVLPEFQKTKLSGVHMCAETNEFFLQKTGQLFVGQCSCSSRSSTTAFAS